MAELRVEELGDLTAEELTALADHNERARWVWEQMAKEVERGSIAELTGKFTCEEVAAHHRDRARRFKELAAQEEQTQTEWEGASPRAEEASAD